VIVSFDLLLAARSRLGERRLQRNEENDPQQNNNLFHHVPIVRRTKRILKSQSPKTEMRTAGGTAVLMFPSRLC